MKELNVYLRKISQRGDQYGGRGGILDLLDWCGKDNTACVSLEEAKFYWENPEASYVSFAEMISESEKHG